MLSVGKQNEITWFQLYNLDSSKLSCLNVSCLKDKQQRLETNRQRKT